MFKNYLFLFCAVAPVVAMEPSNDLSGGTPPIVRQKTGDRFEMRDLLDRGMGLPLELQCLIGTKIIKECDPAIDHFAVKDKASVNISHDLFRSGEYFYGDTSSLALSADSSTVVAPTVVSSHIDGASYHPTDFRIFDTGKGKLVSSSFAQGIEYALSPDKKYLVSVTDNGDIKVYETERGEFIKTLSTLGNNDKFAYPTFIPNTDHVVVHNNVSIDTWDVKSGQHVRTIPIDSIDSNEFSCYTISCDPSGLFLMLVGQTKNNDSLAVLWDIAKNEKLQSLFLDGDCTAIAWDHQGRKVAIAVCKAVGENSTANSLCVLDIETGKCIKSIENGATKVNSIAWLCGDTMLALAQKDPGIVSFWLPFSKNNSHCFSGEYNVHMVDDHNNSMQIIDCTMNNETCAIMYGKEGSRIGTLLRIIDFSGIENIYKYLDKSIPIDQAILLFAIEKKKIIDKKYALDRNSKKIFDQLPEYIQYAYKNHVNPKPWYYYTMAYRAIDNYLYKTHQICEKMIGSVRLG